MYPFFYDPSMIFLIPALLFAAWAQWKVQSTFARYSQKPSRSGKTAEDVAYQILLQHGIQDVIIEHTPGQLTDHYDPRKKVLRLSDATYGSDSIAAIGVAAHEAGHAVQHARAFLPLVLRNLIYPVAAFSSYMAFPLFFLGFLAGLPFLIDLGIYLFAGTVAFHLVTLPVEIDASRRAVAVLKQGYMDERELRGVKSVLTAAALTYIAATLMALLQLARLLWLRNRD
ncbi:Putative membrane protease YugP [Brevinematales bacterium NS]|nr:Putative membrane protease YugP [Brevinematales bacterium NS]